MTKRVLASIIVIVIFFGAIAVRFMWIRAWRTNLTSDGRPVIDARIYRNWSGDVLIDLRPESGDLYVVRKSAAVVGIPNATFFIEGPAFVLARENPLRIVDIRTEKAGGIDPNLTVGSQGLSFRAIDGKTIKLLSY